MQFEDYISDEVIRYVDSHFRTIPDRKARAISGLSMGGHGAMWNAIRHRDVFGAVGSTSGGLDIRPFPTNWKMKDQLGEFVANKKRWDEHTVINLIPSLNDGRSRHYHRLRSRRFLSRSQPKNTSGITHP